VRRLNQEFLDQAIDALVAGIYAGDPHQLSLTHAFPKLKALEDNYGSLIKGQIFGAGARKRSGEVAKDRAPKFSFDEGLQVLPDTLAEQLGEAVKLNTAVTKLTQTADGWVLTVLENGREPQGNIEHPTSNIQHPSFQIEHSAVIYCGTAFRLAELQIELQTNGNAPLAPALSPLGGEREKTATCDAAPSPRPSGERVVHAGRDRERGNFMSLDAFSEIRYPPVASVVLGFRREDVAHPCEGFGMLIPKIEGFKILGTIFSSSLFPNRAPTGHLTLTSYIGGQRYPELALLPTEKLVALTCEDLRVLLGVTGKPVFQHCVLYPKAIPQYNVGYGRYRELMNDIENRAAGFFFAGHYRDGVSLGDTIVSGVNIVERVTNFIETTDKHR
jgi:oxygen-dependent protoporphyrinogen oxidase